MGDFDKPVQCPDWQLAKISRTSIRMIRYFENNGLISVPERKPRGYRVFTPTHVTEIQWVKKMQELGFSLAEIKRFRDAESSTLSDGQKTEALQAVFLDKRRAVESQIAHLQAVKGQLEGWNELRQPRR